MPLIPFFGSDGTAYHAQHISNHNPLSQLDNDILYANPVMPRSLGDFHSVNATTVLAMNEQHIKQVLATVTSSISLASAVCAVYWFCMMRRNFRRDLVLLLIMGGSWKSLWFMVFSVVTFVRGTINTETTFCQASGYMLQVGFEMCDIAVLFMSMHMYLQIFPPNRLTFFGHDGLYRLRHWVVAAWFILPNLSAALAFVNPRPAFMAQGGFCTLPLRPFWYRLALFWIPRYLIWIYIVFVAISITRYVGSEFKVFGQERDSSTSQVMPSSSTDKNEASNPPEVTQKRFSRLSTRLGDGLLDHDQGEPSPDDIEGGRKVQSKKRSPPEYTKSQQSGSRRSSLFDWGIAAKGLDASATPFASQTTSKSASRRGSRQVAAGVSTEDPEVLAESELPGRRASTVSQGSTKSAGAVSFGEQPILAPIVEVLPSNVKSNIPRQNPNQALRVRRAAIQRQLRLLFIYPCIYMMLWVVPFVVNCMNYFDYWAQHPVFPLNALSLACMTSMTSVDVFVFCWRERPWRHIPGSDGTFLGSFMFWRFCFGGTWAVQRRASRAPSAVPDTEDEQGEKADSRTRLLASLKRWSIGRKNSSHRGSESGQETTPRMWPTHRRMYSGGSDRRHREAERAQERLAMERAEYESNRRSLQERQESVISQQEQEAGKKDWFDRQVSNALAESGEKNALDDKPAVD